MQPALATGPIARPGRLHVSVQDRLKSHILDNRMKPGEPLPPEIALAQALGVSRTSVREAVKALESVGVLETRHGVGVFVREFSFGPLIDHLGYSAAQARDDLAAILEVRCTLESGLIDKAIGRMTDADRAALADIVAAMHAKAAAGLTFTREDQAFHTALFACLDNRVLTRVLDVFWQAFHHAADLETMGPRDLMRTWRDHDRIARAVLIGDANDARARLFGHYHGLNARLMRKRD